jgi:hypothetical protein
VVSPVLESVCFTIVGVSMPVMGKLLPWEDLIGWIEKHGDLTDVQWRLGGPIYAELSTLAQIVREKFALYGRRSASVLRFVDTPNE